MVEIDDSYVDGSCVNSGEFYERWYCVEENILIYRYDDSSCQ